MLTTVAVLSAAPFANYSIVVLQNDTELYYDNFFAYQAVDKCKELVKEYGVEKIIVLGPSTYIPNVIDKISTSLNSIVVVGGYDEVTD